MVEHVEFRRACVRGLHRRNVPAHDSQWRFVPRSGHKVALAHNPPSDRSSAPNTLLLDTEGMYRAVIGLSKGDRSVVARQPGGIIRLMAPSPRSVSIIVPTYCEAPNLEPLITQTFAALSRAGIEAELIIVDDDSRDGTERIVERFGDQYPVRLVVRRGVRGLSGAVLAGFREARFDRFVVLDADLQHPPEMVPELAIRLDCGDCDFVIGTRYGGAGSIAADWPVVRKFGSGLATLLARPLARLSDPMSGFFALHRRTWEQAAPLDPIGYKIALELFVKGRCRHPAEVPIAFAARRAGVSKVSFAEGRRYVRHLARLYRFRFPRIAEALRISVIVLAALIILVCACHAASGTDARSTELRRRSNLYAELSDHES